MLYLSYLKNFVTKTHILSNGTVLRLYRRLLDVHIRADAVLSSHHVTKLTEIKNRK